VTAGSFVHVVFIEKGGSVGFTQIRVSLHKYLPLATHHWLNCGFL
jgi:hypothetical protein